MTAMLQYFLNNVPMASWQKVAGALYMMKEEKALQVVKKFLTASRGELASSPGPLPREGKVSTACACAGFLWRVWLYTSQPST